MKIVPSGGKLPGDKGGVTPGKRIRWTEVETADAQQFSQVDLGSPEKPSRLAPDALILQERLGVTERELVEQIADNSSLHYVVGLISKIHGQLR